MSQSPSEENTPLINSSKAYITKNMVFWTIGALYGASAVGLGAFGAHGLKKKIADPAKIASWSSAAQYQVRATPHVLLRTSDMVI